MFIYFVCVPDVCLWVEPPDLATDFVSFLIVLETLRKRWIHLTVLFQEKTQGLEGGSV